MLLSFFVGVCRRCILWQWHSETRGTDLARVMGGNAARSKRIGWLSTLCLFGTGLSYHSAFSRCLLMDLYLHTRAPVKFPYLASPVCNSVCGEIFVFVTLFSLRVLAFAFGVRTN